MRKLSVALLTKNDAVVVDNCLKSLSWADEIVILDGFSTDGTLDICKKYTDKIFQKKFESFAIERDFILGKTTHDWVLSVDADMFFSEEICEEIRDILKQDAIKYDAFLTKGLTVFLGAEIRHCSWFDYRYVRLFNKTKGAYDLRYKALDIFYVKGPKGKMKNHFMHYSKEGFIDYFGKIKRLSYLTAVEYQWKGLKITPWNAFFYFFIKPFLIFVYKYFYKRGFLDGVVGIIVCINSAISYYVAYAALWDIQRNEKLNNTGQLEKDRKVAYIKDY